MFNSFCDLDQSASRDIISLPHSQRFPLNFMVISSQSLGLVNLNFLLILYKMHIISGYFIVTIIGI